MLRWRQYGKRIGQPLLAPGTRLTDDVIIDRLIRDDGTGQLYEGVDQSLQRPVMIRCAHDLSSLLLQVKAQDNVPPSACASVFRVSRTSGVPYLITEKVEGRTLRVVSSSQKLTLLDAVALARELATLVGSLHTQSVTLGDLTSDTVIRGNNRLVLTQFAFGQGETLEPTAIHDDRRRPGVFERHRDVYSLAEILTEMIVGAGNVGRGRTEIRTQLFALAVPSALVELLVESLDPKGGSHYDALSFAHQLTVIEQDLRKLQGNIAVWIADRDVVRARRYEQQVMRSGSDVEVRTFNRYDTLLKTVRQGDPAVIVLDRDITDDVLTSLLELQQLLPTVKLVFVGRDISPKDIQLMYQLGAARVIPAGPRALPALWDVVQEIRQQEPSPKSVVAG